MSRRKIELPKNTLYTLYHLRNKSPYFIGKKYRCSFATVTNRIREYGIPVKSKAKAQTRYKKFDFSGNLIEKAYLIGFRIGDLNVYKTSPNAETIVVRTHTTSKDQLRLFKNVFKKYGHITITDSKERSVNINCFLNKSFSFLLSKNKNIDLWIRRNGQFFTAFIAGYIDAEGSFGVYQRRARFKLDSYDRKIILQIYKRLEKNEIHCKFFRVGKKGQLRPEGYVFNSDLWRLNVNESGSLEKLIYLIRPFIKHGKRKVDIKQVLNNIKIRKKKGTIK